MQALTQKQQRLFNFYKEYIAQHNECPTIAHVAREIGLKSHSSVYPMLDNIEKLGYLRRYQGGIVEITAKDREGVLERRLELLDAAINMREILRHDYDGEEEDKITIGMMKASKFLKL